MSDVKLSFGIVCYNQGDNVAKIIQTIMDMNLKYKFEIIISDDNSSDNTLDILRQLQNKYNDIVHIYQSEPFTIRHNSAYDRHIKISKNKANVYNNMNGEYICFIDGDDMYMGGVVQIVQ